LRRRSALLLREVSRSYMALVKLSRSCESIPALVLRNCNSLVSSTAGQSGKGGGADDHTLGDCRD
jgi:hypothetical protein